MKRLIVIFATIAACSGAAWAVGVGSRCVTDFQCATSGLKLVCNSYYGICLQPGLVGTHCLRDADCRASLYCSARSGYTCQQR